MKFVNISGSYKVEMKGLLAPDEIRTLRKKIGLAQVQCAALFGGGPNAFSRYETGKTKPSPSTCNLLILLSEMGVKNES